MYCYCYYLFVIAFVDYICISVGVPVSGSTVFSSEEVCARPEEAEYGGVYPPTNKGPEKGPINRGRSEHLPI